MSSKFNEKYDTANKCPNVYFNLRLLNDSWKILYKEKIHTTWLYEENGDRKLKMTWHKNQIMKWNYCYSLMNKNQNGVRKQKIFKHVFWKKILFTNKTFIIIITCLCSFLYFIQCFLNPLLLNERMDWPPSNNLENFYYCQWVTIFIVHTINQVLFYLHCFKQQSCTCSFLIPSNTFIYINKRLVSYINHN